MYYIFEKYFNDMSGHELIPIAVDVLTAGDYHLYLYEAGSGWYVVVEADYLFVTDVARDIEASFPVKVEGWCTLAEYGYETGVKLLPPHVFKNESVNESDEDWEHYHSVVYRDGGIVYAVLKVHPKSGVSIKDFGLTFYREG